MKIVDAKGIPCPKPLILVKTALTNASLNDEIKVLLDDDVAFQNIKDFLDSNGINYTTDSLNFTIIKNKELSSNSSNNKNTIVVIDKNRMGHGEDELGELLLKTFLSTIKELSTNVSAIYCYNSGVKIGVDKSYQTILQELREIGVKIYFCGACVKYFELTEIDTTEQTNMLSIMEAMSNATNILRP